jgi:tRNA (guanine37-N1)-methyltransferase
MDKEWGKAHFSDTEAAEKRRYNIILKIDILTLFPGMFEPILGESIIKRAREKKLVRIKVHDLRSYTTNRHKKADDKPFGGGPGMVILAEPLFKAIDELRTEKTKIIYLTPQGKKLNQGIVRKFSGYEHIIMICGHYEGIDERVRQKLVTDEVSIGDYVLTCGELPAMVLADCIIRLIPGVLGDERSSEEESFSGNLLEYPQYTRPATFRGMKVPEVLLSGNHEKIKKWRRRQSVLKTAKTRPDLIKKAGGKNE